MLIAGVMSGTSLDGIEVALVEVTGTVRRLRWRLVTHQHTAYRPAEKAALLACAEGHGGTEELARLHFALGRRFGRAVLAACKRAGVAPAQLAAVAAHGQTVYHQGGVASLQLGEPACIAAVTGVGVVANFRAADIAAGGQGAPLVPWVDALLWRHPTRYRAALNLGGIANLTLLPPRSSREVVIAFDTGPGNMVMDALARRTGHPYDRGGRLAARGKVQTALLRRLLAAPYYRQTPPKSAGREQYGEAFIERHFQTGSAANLMATACALTAQTVARGLRHASATGEVIVSGGGVHNATLMAQLAAATPAWRWRRSEELGMPATAKEAIAFALLGWAHLRGIAANLPSATGARRAVVLGSFTPPPC